MLASHFYATLRRRSGSLKGMRMIEMNQLQSGIVEAASKVRANNPLAGSITNSVTIDLVANAQLAVGGSAAMVYLPDEGECLVAAGGAVYINMGTLLPVYEETLPRTAAAAHAAGKPWVLDPVGIGIGSLRTKLLRGFKPYKPAIVRGNASEIIALAGLWDLEGDASELSRARGVDTTDTVAAARDAAVALARYTGGAVAVSGESDLVTDGSTVAYSTGGSASDVPSVAWPQSMPRRPTPSPRRLPPSRTTTWRERARQLRRTRPRASRSHSSTSFTAQRPTTSRTTRCASRRPSMNTLIAVAIAPFGVGDELSSEVAEVVKVIRESGLPNRTYSMFTEIEGEWDEVMRVVRDATFVLAEKGIRTEVILKADVRPGFSRMMDEKVARVNALLDGESSKGAQDADNPNSEGSKTNGSNPNGSDDPSDKFAANENKEVRA